MFAVLKEDGLWYLYSCVHDIKMGPYSSPKRALEMIETFRAFMVTSVACHHL